jgi:formate hydrogenlyase transcriptional activator
LTSVSTVAPTDATVLVLGETGTGKELVARAIHRLSTRRDKPFVRLSGAALPPGLLESELFGYEKGAFTGANSSRMGRIELANHGTLFLDEVGDIPADLQPKLLRVLQEREFERLGSTQTRHVDVRLIAATNRDLQAMVEEGIFRADLYYRLNVFPIKIPSLRDRRDDIPALARHFTERFARRLHRPTPSIPGPAMDALRNWDWPGNIRELENVIERAVILSPASDLRVPLEDLRRKDGRRAITGGGRTPGGPTLEESERETILRALRESGGIVAGPDGAAARLGVKRTTLQSMMRKLGIRRPSY